MIKWMSEEVNKAWDDNCPFLFGIICETHGDELKGHIVIQLEDGDFVYQLDLGDCSDIADEEIDRRFRDNFHQFVDAYADCDDCSFAELEKLEGLLEDIS